MAVYERAYRPYTGPLTVERRRVLILPRYAIRDVFRSRLFTAFFALCFVCPVVYSILIYLHHNASALKILDLSRTNLLSIDAGFFLVFLRIQASLLGFLMVLVVGPALVAPDLRNNALPLYLSRPFTRSDYVIGKMIVLAGLLSAITWIPGIALFGLQSYLEGFAWMRDHLRIAVALCVASWVFILVLSLLALAISATVKWKPVAAAALVGVFLVAAATGTAFNAIFNTSWGSVISLGDMIERVWTGLFGTAPSHDVPVVAAWACLAAVGAGSLGLLARKLRAFEVVR
jgi:ABC-2 type transport system permease protein